MNGHTGYCTCDHGGTAVAVFKDRRFMMTVEQCFFVLAKKLAIW